MWPMKKYLVTAHENYYPEPGPHDWVKTFHTLEEAKDYLNISPDLSGVYDENTFSWKFRNGFTSKGADYVYIINLEEWMK
jgi:hypothetical protein